MNRFAVRPEVLLVAQTSHRGGLQEPLHLKKVNRLTGSSKSRWHTRDLTPIVRDLLRSTTHLFATSAFSFSRLFTMKFPSKPISMNVARHIALTRALRGAPLQVLQTREPRPISAAEEEALRAAARGEDLFRWTARMAKVLTENRLEKCAVVTPDVRSTIAREAKRDALRTVRLKPADAPPTFEALVALLFDGVHPRAACEVARQHIDQARLCIAFEDLRGRTTDYRLSTTTHQLLTRLPYVSAQQPLLGLKWSSLTIAWRRICEMAALPELSMLDVRCEAVRRRGHEEHAAQDDSVSGRFAE